MSSAATRNARSEAVRRSGRSRGHSREIRLTLIYDQLVAEVVLDENQTVHYLWRFIETRFKIPERNQVVFGWPVGIEPSNSSVKIKDLVELETEVQLQVAIKGEIDFAEISFEDDDGQRPGTSRDMQASSSSSLRLPDSSQENQTYQLHVTDLKNGETYDEIPFEGYMTVREVKISFGDLTGIPLSFQKWSGWPDIVDEGLEEKLPLKNIGLDRPFHSLFLTDLRESASNIPAESNSGNSDTNTNPTTNTVSEQNLTQENNDVDLEEVPCSSSNITAPDFSTIVGTSNCESVANKAIADEFLSPCNIQPGTSKNGSDRIQPKKATAKSNTARKSTTKGALRDIIQRKKHTDSSDSDSGLSQNEDIGRKSSSNSGNSHGPHNNLDDSFLSTFSDGGSNSTTSECNNESQFGEKRRNDNQEIPGPSTPKKTRLTDNISQAKSPRKHYVTLPTNSKIVENILKYLDPKAILSLRRVCKTTKAWISNRTYPFPLGEEERWNKFRITITGHDTTKTFQTVVDMNLPITRFIFEVTDEQFYNRLDIETFICHASLRVKDVTLRKFFMFQNPDERKLFQSFVNIEKLTMDELVVPKSSSNLPLPCPNTLKNLQVLKLNYEITIPQDGQLIRPRDWDFTWSMLYDCVSLFYFRLPRFKETRLNSISNSFGIFAPLLEYISMRVKSGGVSLEYLDLKHFNDPESNYICRFVDLIRRCYHRDIKLKNVQSLVIQQVFDEDGSVSDDKYRFCENIISLINYCPFLENAPLQNLEKITVDVIPSVTEYKTLGRAYKDLFWPKLKTIKIKDSIELDKTDEIWRNWQEVQEDLYGHNGLFDRGGVQYIKIDSPKLPYFLSEGRLAQKFYNLKRLEIVSWCNNDKCLDKRLNAAWKKLKLEELRIENCPKLNDACFLGGESSPEFLKLKPTLKKITLGLDKTNVTDKSFKVFRHMHFKSFILISKRPTKISEAAILTLEKNEFGQHIEHFPFDTWSSASIDRNRFERLGKRFRSIR